MNWDEMAVVGRVARAHGLRGQVIVNSETDFPHERFQPGAELFVKRTGGSPIETLTIETVRFHRERPVIGLREIADVNAAEQLAGQEFRVPLDRLMVLPAGMFYRHDLTGCEVETVDGTAVGTVTEVEGELGGSRLVVRTNAGDVLVPLVAEICRTIDPASRRIVIAPPEGLLDVNR